MVVVEALRELNKESQCWHLERVCDEVTCRGHVVDGLTPSQAECMIRCEVGDGMGQGFFVCVFVRDTGTQLSEAERKKKEKEYIEMRKEPEFPITPVNHTTITMIFINTLSTDRICTLILNGSNQSQTTKHTLLSLQVRYITTRTYQNFSCNNW